VSLNPPRPTEGASIGTVTLATFAYPDASTTRATYGATITWGDNKTEAGQIVDNGDGTFSVQGSHTYDEAAQNLPFNVRLTDDSNNPAQDHGQSIDVTEAPLTLASLTPPANPTEGVATDGLVAVATFRDANPKETGADLTATIVWGDGSTSPGLIGDNHDGTFSVYGGHTYSEEAIGADNALPFTIIIEDAGDPRGATILIPPAAPVNVEYAVVSQVDLGVGSPTVNTTTNRVTGSFTLTFQDADPQAGAFDYGVTVTWSDGSVDNFSGADLTVNPDGTFSIADAHSWDSSLSSFSFKVSVADGGAGFISTGGWQAS
jgi:hypothetical protein